MTPVGPVTPEALDRTGASGSGGVPQRLSPEEVPRRPLLVDTDVVSWMALGEEGGRVCRAARPRATNCSCGVRLHDVVTKWVALRAASMPTRTVDNRECWQNDTWIAGCALSVEPPTPVVTGNTRDLTALAAVSNLRVVNPGL